MVTNAEAEGWLAVKVKCYTPYLSQVKSSFHLRMYISCVAVTVHSGNSVIRHSVGNSIVPDYRGCWSSKRFLV